MLPLNTSVPVFTTLPITVNASFGCNGAFEMVMAAEIFKVFGAPDRVTVSGLVKVACFTKDQTLSVSKAE